MKAALAQLICYVGIFLEFTKPRIFGGRIVGVLAKIRTFHQSNVLNFSSTRQTRSVHFSGLYIVKYFFSNYLNATVCCKVQFISLLYNHIINIIVIPSVDHGMQTR
jgi:hypothetical protein